MLRGLRNVLACLFLAAFVGCFIEHTSYYCNQSADCTDPAFPVCDTGRHACASSSVQLDMGGGDIANPVSCTSSAMCPASAPTCSPQGVCAACAPSGMSSDCNTYHSSTPLCGTNGSCVECNSKDNCDSKHLTCDTTTFTCVSCKVNADCTSGVCNTMSGFCVDESMLLYVNNATNAGCADGGPGSFAAPFCTVQRGLNAAAAAGKQLVVFAGTGYHEALQANSSLNAGNNYVVSVVGNGNPTIQPVGNGPVLNILGNSTKQVTVTLDGVTLDGSQLTDGSDVVDCAGGGGNYGATVVNVYRSAMKSSSALGISSTTKCTVALDADLLQGNKGGAIKMDATDFALTNLLVLSNGTATQGGTNGSSFGGIDVSAIGEIGKMSMANLTVVGNKADNNATASAMQCPVTAPKTINTVVFGNTGPAAEIQTACIGTVATPTVSYSAYVGGSGTMNNLDLTGCTAAMLFTNAAGGNYLPVKGGAKPCTLVDQGTNVGAPDHDYVATPRPQPVGGTDDIGAYEAP